LVEHNELGFRNVSGSALNSFASSECRDFYSDPSTKPTPAGGWLALEDMHRGGRDAAFTQGVLYQEVILSQKWKFGYVLVRKSGSTAVQRRLKQLFDADWLWCRERCGNVSACFGIFGLLETRCTTMALGLTEINNFFFFSFARHPIARWWSQYAQAHVMWGMTDVVPTVEKAMAALVEMGTQSLVSEHHLQTQMHSLTSRTWLGTPVPMHFVGRVETMDRDWEFVVREIWRRNGAKDYATRVVDPLAEFGHHEQNRDKFVAQMSPLKSDAQLIDMIRQVYTQDLVCFGY
jgi:hypothetical protein